jgi:hypothetical protein
MRFFGKPRCLSLSGGVDEEKEVVRSLKRYIEEGIQVFTSSSA